MFIKVTNGQPSKYPYTLGQLRRENPRTSFPRVIPEETLAAYDVYKVDPKAPTRFDNKTHRLTETVENVDGAWKQKWVQKQLPEDRASANARRHRDQLLSETDYFALTDVTMGAAMTTYRQALRDITNHVNFPYMEEADWPVKP